MMNVNTTPPVITVIDDMTTREVNFDNVTMPTTLSPLDNNDSTDSTLNESTSSTVALSTAPVAIEPSTTLPNLLTSSPSSVKPKPVQCPDLETGILINITITDKHDNNNNGNDNNPTSDSNNINTSISDGQNLQLSSVDRTAGTVVRAECSAKSRPLSVVYLKCQSDGRWNSTLPVCYEQLDVSSYRLYFAVVGGVCGLSLLVLFILYCHLLRARRKKTASSPNTPPTEPARNIYVDPYAVGERLYRTPSSSHYATSDITYAKPVVYSTYLNPSFYEDAYERWRRQEQRVSEKLYDSPWIRPRGLKNQMDTADFKWSQTSLKTIGESGFKRLPRAQVSIDHASIKSNDSIGRQTSTRSHVPLYSQSSVASTDSMLRRYPSMAAHEVRSDSPIGQKSPRGDEDACSTLAEVDRDSSDGLTNF